MLLGHTGFPIVNTFLVMNAGRFVKFLGHIWAVDDGRVEYRGVQLVRVLFQGHAAYALLDVLDRDRAASSLLLHVLLVGDLVLLVHV